MMPWKRPLPAVPVLDADPSLLCVSSWNDNGQAQFVADPEALYRSDFFPGLGWMLNKVSGRWLGWGYSIHTGTGIPRVISARA